MKKGNIAKYMSPIYVSSTALKKKTLNKNMYVSNFCIFS